MLSFAPGFCFFQDSGVLASSISFGKSRLMPKPVFLSLTDRLLGSIRHPGNHAEQQSLVGALVVVWVYVLGSGLSGGLDGYICSLDRDPSPPKKGVYNSDTILA